MNTYLYVCIYMLAYMFIIIYIIDNMPIINKIYIQSHHGRVSQNQEDLDPSLTSGIKWMFDPGQISETKLWNRSQSLIAEKVPHQAHLTLIKSQI